MALGRHERAVDIIGRAGARSSDAGGEDRMPADPDELLRMYRVMVLIRQAEERLIQLFAAGRMPGFIHSYIGEEATAAGVCAALRADDYLTSTHRGHGHILAKGGDLVRFFAELYGKASGYCRGKGGSMHVTDLDLGILGANGIVGAGIPIAAGAALACRMQGIDRVAVAFLGDGATDIGVFHEALNMASLWEVPAIFVCENNGYADFMARAAHQRIERIADRAAAYSMPGETVDGNDVEAVHDAATRAVARARSGGGPTLIECVTYRWRGHYEGDPQPYRTSAEVEEWKRRDPLGVAEGRLREAGALGDEQRAALWNEISAAIDAAVEAAERAPMPELGEALEDVYADSVQGGWA
jgi:acetoin:2,6-dichlorophenolindophenol oxidoreductase subunit alpha